MLNAYVHSVIDYGLDISAIQSEIMLNQIQGKINRFLVKFFLPNSIRRAKLDYDKIKNSIDMNEMLLKCNFLTVTERSHFVILKNLYANFKSEKVEFTMRTKVRICH